MKKAIILCLLLSLGGCGAVEPTPTVTPTSEPTPIPTPTVTPVPTPYITPVPTPEVTDHPDYEKHYISREYIEGYEKMSESQIQKILDVCDIAFDEGYELGREFGRSEGYEEGYDEGVNE